MIYLNGEFLALAEAKVSVMDRGFLFGDGVYEVIPVYSRRPFRLAQHLKRLGNTLAGVRLDNPHSEPEWTRLIARIIDQEESADQQIYLQVTRGVDVRRSHAFPRQVRPTTLIMSEPLLPPAAVECQRGVAAVSAVDIRWLRCDLKVVSLLANCLLRQLAVDAGCAETLLLRDGFLSEGAASNIFLVKDGLLLAPQQNHLMLPGVTYDVVLELAAAHGLKHQVRDILEAEVRTADELWLTSSTREVLAIVNVDGQPVGKGEPGPYFRQMYGWYQDFKREVMHGGQ